MKPEEAIKSQWTNLIEGVGRLDFVSSATKEGLLPKAGRVLRGLCEKITERSQHETWGVLRCKISLGMMRFALCFR